MFRAITLSFALVAAGGCVGLMDRAPGACEVLTADDVASTLRVTGVKKADGSGMNDTTHVDTCTWTANGNARIELRVFRTDSSSGDALKTVFESSRVYATKPDASGRTRARELTGVGEDAMLLDAGAGTSVAFRVGRTGATLIGTASEDALIELAKRAAGRLR